MRNTDPPPEDHLRCKRTDGRQWRCKRRALDGKSLCDIHHQQGKHRQNRKKVPGSLKLERNVTKKRETSKSTPRVLKLNKVQVEKKRQRRVSEALDDVLKRLKLKRDDLQLDLIRVFLKRQVEKKKEKEMKEIAVEDETREFELPYGVMAISESPSKFHERNAGLDVKLGVDLNGNSCMQRHFRWKNIEPLPVGTMQVVPFAEIVKKKRMKKCHFCRESKNCCLIKCFTCKKRFFCVECIKERNLEKQEVKVNCPACLGTCSCKLCMKQQPRTTNSKECYRSGKKSEKNQLLQYLIYTLLPVLKQINREQSIELEIEVNITGKRPSEIQILQTKVGSHTLLCCNRCKTSIVDYHRTCTNCSYNLCLCCCHEFSRHGPYKSFKLKNCKKRKICQSGDKLLLKHNLSGRNSADLPCHSRSSMQNWEASTDGSIPCPPTDIGGCGDSLLQLRCTFPFTWTGDLEVRAEEILYSYGVPETADISLSCLLCKDSVSKDDEVKTTREFSKRIDICDNHLYCPTMKNLHQETLEHFQNHWGKGHPVIVRNVLRITPGLCWDPVIMFCSYMESKISRSCKSNLKGSRCLDWCEVEITKKHVFMGSFDKRTHASMKQKVLKFKAWLSSHLFQKQFPEHYNEILSALPLPEYINPVCGLLNVTVKLPKELPNPDLGPCLHFAYGGPEELGQPDFLSQLHYEAHDTVNILVHATYIPIPSEQINTVENLLKRYKAQDQESFSNSCSQKGKPSLQSENTCESGLQDTGEYIPFCTGNPLKGQKMAVENGNLSEDTESDDDASVICCGSIEKSEDTDEYFLGEDRENSCCSEDKGGSDSSGAQWDIFRRQDAPKLMEYLKKHSNELNPACSYSKFVHPILDQNFFLDAYHKLKLKEEFDIQPWTFEQCPGEAIFIPAGCPYQIRRIKSCVSVVLDFISPESATQCILLKDEIRALPTWHKVKRKLLEVEKMALHGVSSAIEDLCNLTRAEQVIPGEKAANAPSRSRDRRLFEAWLKQHNSRSTGNPQQQK